MNKNIELLKESIRHWERMRDGEEPADHYMSEYCPLCKEYASASRDFNCIDCPIAKFSGRLHCHGTPWVDYQMNPTPENAQKEILFLHKVLMKELEKEEELKKKEPEWIDITEEIEWKCKSFGEYGYFLFGEHNKSIVLQIITNNLKEPEKENYKIKKVPNRGFRILKKNDKR